VFINEGFVFAMLFCFEKLSADLLARYFHELSISSVEVLRFGLAHIVVFTIYQSIVQSSSSAYGYLKLNTA